MPTERLLLELGRREAVMIVKTCLTDGNHVWLHSQLLDLCQHVIGNCFGIVGMNTHSYRVTVGCGSVYGRTTRWQVVTNHH